MADKVRLLQAAYAAGNLDLAMSLAEAMKETLVFEQQLRGTAPEPAVGAKQFVAVDDLPKAWARWARGWKVCKPLNLFETVGIERVGEPLDLAIAFRHDHATDLGRELRVARLDPATNALQEVACQVYAETRRAMRDSQAAVRLHRRALSIREEALGHDHPDVAISLNNLGMVLADAGESGEGSRLVARAVTILAGHMAMDHPKRFTVQANLAKLRRVAG